MPLRDSITVRVVRIRAKSVPTVMTYTFTSVTLTSRLLGRTTQIDFLILRFIWLISSKYLKNKRDSRSSSYSGFGEEMGYPRVLKTSSALARIPLLICDNIMKKL